MTRIAPLEPPYTGETAAQLAEMMPAGAAPIALFRVFAKNLPMARAMTGWGRYELGRELTLTRREREIVIVRTCARNGCEYEWGVHVAVFAERVGFGAAELAALTTGRPDDPCWTQPREQALIRAVDQLSERADLDDATWAALRELFDEAELLDTVLLCGWYRAISLVARTLRVPGEPGAPTFAEIAAPR
jgi:alkylhydroperoxidase family enzyme